MKTCPICKSGYLEKTTSNDYEMCSNKKCKAVIRNKPLEINLVRPGER